MERAFQLNVNGKSATVVTDENRPLLDVLREDLGLTGTKYGCGEGDCGACTVLMNHEAVRSCITTVADAHEQSIQTIEGLAAGGQLHRVQQAFVQEHAVQCGYCVPGQIITAVALLVEKPNPSREEIVQAITGNICRCCNYPHILAAVERAAQLGRAPRDAAGAATGR